MHRLELNLWAGIQKVGINKCMGWNSINSYISSVQSFVFFSSCREVFSLQMDIKGHTSPSSTLES